MEGLICNILERSTMFNRCEFINVRKEANECAHRMAKVDLQGLNTREFMGSLPISACNPDLQNI